MTVQSVSIKKNLSCDITVLHFYHKLKYLPKTLKTVTKQALKIEYTIRRILKKIQLMWPFRNDGPSFVSDTFRHKPSINKRIRMLLISHSCSNHSSLEMEAECLTKTLPRLMMICGWTPLTSQYRPENDHKRQCICQIRHEKMKGVRPIFQICLLYIS